MAIVNAGMIQVYENLDPKLRTICEDVILNRRDSAVEELLELAQELGKSASGGEKISSSTWRTASMCRAASIACAWFASGDSCITPRVRPLTCTGTGTIATFTSDAEATGNGC